ncbi:MAG: metalloregulator ArsR/SmtB family transcription factor [Pirellulales bacterium]|nr:metalloregulator ArsR/SmtB family transcription factor [Pirellulales bacterium]
MITKLEVVDAPEVDITPVAEPAVKDLVTVFKLLSDETRLRIVILLSNVREMHVRALCELLRQSQPAVSHHLALLRVAGLIECRREGKHNFYRVVRQRIPSLLDAVFAQVPAAHRSIRFADYVLSYRPEAVAELV